MQVYNNIVSKLNDKHALNSVPSFLTHSIDRICVSKFPIDFFTNYVYWNSMFAGCVTSLSSRFHLWPYTDTQEGIFDKVTFKAVEKLKKQKSHLISGYIIASAEDEYCEKQYENRITHKQIAWVFICGIFDYFKKDIKLNISDYTKTITATTYAGYGVNTTANLLNLSKNLGFHLASEKYASNEFNLLHTALYGKYPDFYEHLCKYTLDNQVYGIDWIKNHGTLEQEHFQISLKALAELTDSIEEMPNGSSVINAINTGIENFCTVQGNFFAYY